MAQPAFSDDPIGEAISNKARTAILAGWGALEVGGEKGAASLGLVIRNASITGHKAFCQAGHSDASRARLVAFSMAAVGGAGLVLQRFSSMRSMAIVASRTGQGQHQDLRLSPFARAGLVRTVHRDLAPVFASGGFTRAMALMRAMSDGTLEQEKPTKAHSMAMLEMCGDVLAGMHNPVEAIAAAKTDAQRALLDRARPDDLVIVEFAARCFADHAHGHYSAHASGLPVMLETATAARMTPRRGPAGPSVS